MKSIAAILLLGILLFNWGGYRLLSSYFEERADATMQARLDNDQYNEKDLIHLKVAATLPYGVSSDKFERVDGSVEINGVTYTYVKRRFYQDTMEVVCIPNTERAGIKNARDEFAKLANDFSTNNNSSKKATHNAHSAKFSVQDFTNDHHFFSWQFGNAGLKRNWNTTIFAELKSEYLSRLDRPPQA